MGKLVLLGGAPVRAAVSPHQTIERDDLGAVGDALTADWITQRPTVARFATPPRPTRRAS